MKHRKGCLIPAAVFGLLCVIAGWRLYEYFLLPNWEHRAEIAADWEGMLAAHAEWNEEWHARILSLQAERLQAPIWDELRALPPDEPIQDFTPTHMTNAPWASSPAEPFLELLRDFVREPWETPNGELDKTASVLADVESHIGLTPIEQAVDPRERSWEEVQESMQETIAGWDALDWAVAEIREGVAMRELIPLDPSESRQYYLMDYVSWSPWMPPALIIAAQAHWAIEAGDYGSATEHVETMYRLAGRIETDPALTLHTLRMASNVREVADRVVWRLVDRMDDPGVLRERLGPYWESRESLEPIEHALRLTAAYEHRLRYTGRGFDERLAIHGIYGTALQAIEGLEAGDVQAVLNERVTELPEFARYTANFIDEIDEILIRRARERAMPQLFDAALGLKAYKAEYGTYPETIEEIPGVDLPLSFYSQSPFQYARVESGFVLTSPETSSRRYINWVIRTIYYERNLAWESHE